MGRPDCCWYPIHVIKNALLIMSLALGAAHAQRVTLPVRTIPFVRNPITNLPNQGASLRLPIVTHPVTGVPAPVIMIPVMPHQQLPAVHMRHQTQATAVAEIPENHPVLPAAKSRLMPRNGRGISVEALNSAFDNKGATPKPEPLLEAEEIPETPAPLTLPEWELEREIGVP